MKNYNQNKFQSSFSLDSNFSLKSSKNIIANNISEKEILLLDKKNKSENLSNKISKYFLSNNKNQAQDKNANNQNLIKDINSDNKLNLDLKNSKMELSLQNSNIDPESLTFANKSYKIKEDENDNEELSELSNVDSNIDLEEFNNNILLTQILNDEKHKKMFNKNGNLKKMFEGSILISNTNNNDINDKRKEIYIGQIKAKFSRNWEQKVNIYTKHYLFQK